MVASLEFNSGIGIKKIEKILTKYPNIMDFQNKPYVNSLENIKKISSIDGFQEKTARQFVDNFGNFMIFLTNHKYLKYYIINTINTLDSKNSNKNSYNKIKNKKFVLTGFRDKELIKYIIDNSGIIQPIVNGKTTVDKS